MVDVAVIAAGGLVASCLAVSAYVENAGVMAWKRRWSRVRHVPHAVQPKPWTNRSRKMDAAPPVSLKPATGNAAYCMLCGVRCERPPLYAYMLPGRLYLEVVLCTKCWPKAARDGVEFRIEAKQLKLAYKEIQENNLTDTN